ncbi:hypothetical protein DL768_011096 [Monosporascus sp. mg162]|nr:hypothetical protein DL768_011096 [Monosporascus sp. mg162]
MLSASRAVSIDARASAQPPKNSPSSRSSASRPGAVNAQHGGEMQQRVIIYPEGYLLFKRTNTKFENGAIERLRLGTAAARTGPPFAVILAVAVAVTVAAAVAVEQPRHAVERRPLRVGKTDAAPRFGRVPAQPPRPYVVTKVPLLVGPVPVYRAGVILRTERPPFRFVRVDTRQLPQRFVRYGVEPFDVARDFAVEALAEARQPPLFLLRRRVPQLFPRRAGYRAGAGLVQLDEVRPFQVLRLTHLLNPGRFGVDAAGAVRRPPPPFLLGRQVVAVRRQHRFPIVIGLRRRFRRRPRGPSAAAAGAAAAGTATLPAFDLEPAARRAATEKPLAPYAFALRPTLLGGRHRRRRPPPPLNLRIGPSVRRTAVLLYLFNVPANIRATLAAEPVVGRALQEKDNGVGRVGKPKPA